MLCTRASAFAFVNVPSCPVVLCEVLAPLHPSRVCDPLHFAVCVHAPAPVHALSLHWYAYAVSGLLLFTCMWIPRVCCSAILHSSIVSGLSPPSPSLVSTVYIYYYISVTSAPLPLCVGAHGFASHGCSLIQELAGNSGSS